MGERGGDDGDAQKNASGRVIKVRNFRIGNFRSIKDLSEVLVPVVRRYVLIAGMLWRSAPGLSVLCLALTVGQGAMTTVYLVTSGRLIGSVVQAARAGPGSPAANATWWWLVATGVVLVVGPVLGSWSTTVGKAVAARYLATVYDMTLEVGTHSYGVAELEDPITVGRLDAVAQSQRDMLFLSGIDSIWSAIGGRLVVVGAFVVLLAWRWWVPFVLLAGYLATSQAFARYTKTLFDELLKASGDQRRRATYLRSLLMGGEARKEVRLFDLADFFASRYALVWRAAMGVVWRSRARRLTRMLWAFGLSFTVNAAIFALLARDLSVGALSAGSLVTLVQAILVLGSQSVSFGVPRVAATRPSSHTSEEILGCPPCPRSDHPPSLPLPGRR